MFLLLLDGDISGRSNISLHIDHHRLLLRHPRLSVDDVRMCVEFVERRDAIIECVDACAALFVPPLIAAPNLPLDLFRVAFDVFFENEGLAEVEELGLSAGGLRVARDVFVLIWILEEIKIQKISHKIKKNSKIFKNFTVLFQFSYYFYSTPLIILKFYINSSYTSSYFLSPSSGSCVCARDSLTILSSMVISRAPHLPFRKNLQRQYARLPRYVSRQNV